MTETEWLQLFGLLGFWAAVLIAFEIRGRRRWRARMDEMKKRAAR